MKLTELSPRWIGLSLAGHSKEYLSEDYSDVFCGLSFLCPCCLGRPDSTRIAVLFAPLIDPRNVSQNIAWALPKGTFWTRTSGITFDAISISPSIDSSKQSHWHGTIYSGELK